MITLRASADADETPPTRISDSNRLRVAFVTYRSTDGVHRVQSLPTTNCPFLDS